MMTKKIEIIAEGSGDVKALPVLVERILKAHQIFDVQIAKPVHKRGEITTVRARFDEYFQTAAHYGHPVLCVLDFDCADCTDAVKEELEFLNKAEAIRPQHPFRACFLVKEYESLFLWDEAAVKAVLPNIKAGYVFPTNPEVIRDAKGELSNAQTSGYAYKPMSYQEQLTRHINLDVLREKSPSFQRLEKAVLDLVESMK
jgi:hypothetical protein